MPQTQILWHCTKPFQQRSRSANSPSRSSSSASGTLKSSRTASPSSHAGFATPRSSFDFRFSPDVVLPSIESDTSSNGVFQFGSGSTTNLHNAEVPYPGLPSPSPRRTPSVSVTRTDSSSSNLFTFTSGSGQSVSRETSTLRFSTASPSLDLSGIKDALQDVKEGLDSVGPFLHPRTPGLASPTPSAPGSHRRRSSSRILQEVHKVEDEVPPRDRFNDPRFQRALDNTRQMMTGLLSVMRSSDVHNEPDSQMKRLCGEAARLSQFQRPSTRTVALIGESGVGKSSLLNSILDCDGLARTSNSGAACTCVVTEYHYHQDTNFAIDVDRFSMEEMKTQLQSLLRDYRHFHCNQDDLDSDDYKYFEKRAVLARDTFRVMFRTSLQNEAILTSGPEAEVLETFDTWLRKSSPNIVQGKQSMSNVNDCSELLMRLTSEDASAESSAVWPWIKKIKVYLNAHILRKGLIIVDLPGLRDLNSARRHITERYLIDCNEIFVICNEGRATTDEGVQDVVDLANKAKLSNVGIICTKSDDIKASEAKRDWKGDKAKEVQRKIDVLKQDEEEIKKICEEIKELEEIQEDFDGELNDQENAELLALHNRRRKAKQTKNEHKFDLNRYLIEKRNETVESKLLELYKSQVPGNLLKVFCVSNSIYWDRRRDPKDKAMRYLKLSGILAIREHCMSMVSESQYSAATKYMQDDIDVLLGELTLWVQSGQGSMSVERKQKICDTLETIEGQLREGLENDDKNVGGLSDLYKAEFETRVYQSSSSKLGNWSRAAQHASSQWSVVTSYSAFVRKYGTHNTPAVGPRNWNEEIIANMVEDVAPTWRDLSPVLDQRSSEALHLVDDLFRSAIRLLDTNMPDSRDLKSTLMSHKRVLKTDIEAALETLKDNLYTLGADALSSHRSSLIGEAMKNAYESAQRESGGGSDARRKALINSAVSRNDLFVILLRSFRRRLHTHADQLQESITEAIDEHLEDIHEMFDIVRSENVALESERDPEFRTRVDQAVQAARDELGITLRILED
ncbi:hypothetical protein F5Y18DRAFT_440419 [Xylariaceae sp. FL1019]|nr:hypothetical protein F5Y18DRAFT_440419 [Xylariaceae sp. FL1019]